MLSNYRAIILLVWGEGTVEQRLTDFQDAFSYAAFLFWPAGIAVAAAVATPWAKLLLAWTVALPTELLKKPETNAANEMGLHRQKLAIARQVEELNQSVELIAAQSRDEEARERAKIDRVRRLNEAVEVGGDELSDEISGDREAEDKIEETKIFDVKTSTSRETLQAVETALTFDEVEFLKLRDLLGIEGLRNVSVGLQEQE